MGADGLMKSPPLHSPVELNISITSLGQKEQSERDLLYSGLSVAND